MRTVKSIGSYFVSLFLAPFALARPDARRFENWETNYVTKIGLGVAIDYALHWGLDAIRERVMSLAILRRGVNIDPKLERTVRLQVEGPRYHENAILNEIKCELITSLMESQLRQVAFEVGYTSDESRINTSAEQV